MKKNLALLALAFAVTSLASAKDPSVQGNVKKDDTSVAPQLATTPNAGKVDNNGTKGKVNPAAVKEGAKDPYAVPLLKDARPLNGARD